MIKDDFQILIKTLKTHPLQSRNASTDVLTYIKCCPLQDSATEPREGPAVSWAENRGETAP